MRAHPYGIAWTPSAKRSLIRFPEKVAAAAVECIDCPLIKNSQRVGKALRLELEGLHSPRRAGISLLGGARRSRQLFQGYAPACALS